MVPSLKNCHQNIIIATLYHSVVQCRLSLQMFRKHCRFRHNTDSVYQIILVTPPLQMDWQHLISNSDAEIGLDILSKTTNLDNEIDQFLCELPSLFVWVRRWAYSGFGRFVLKSEYDTVLRKFGDLLWVWAWCESEAGAWNLSTEYWVRFYNLGPRLLTV